MTCSRHLTFTSSGCPACQSNRATTARRTTTGVDTTAQNLLTQSIINNTTAAAACEPASQPAPPSYCDTSSSASFSDPGCAPSC